MREAPGGGLIGFQLDLGGLLMKRGAGAGRIGGYLTYGIRCVSSRVAAWVMDWDRRRKNNGDPWESAAVSQATTTTAWRLHFEDECGFTEHGTGEDRYPERIDTQEVIDRR